MTDCIFCRIVNGDLTARIVHRDEDVVVFRDINPQAPVHLLVIPTRHVSSLHAAGPSDADLLSRLMLAAREAAAREKLESGGYRVVTNVGPLAGQSVFHLHLHVLGGRRMRWPPG